MKLQNIEIKKVNVEKKIDGTKKVNSMIISKKNGNFIVNGRAQTRLFVPVYYDQKQPFFMNCGRRVDVNILPSNDIELIQYNLSLKEVI
jgi:hypothetical protein